MLIKDFFQAQENLTSGRDADKRFFFKDREILLQEEMLIKEFFKDREILPQEEMLIKDFFFQGQGNLASGRDADKKNFFKDREILLQEEMLIKDFFPRTGKSYFRKRC